MAVKSKTPDWLGGDIKVDIARFPYEVFVGKKHVARLFTSYLIDPVNNALAYSAELNRLKEKINDCIDALDAGGVSHQFSREETTDTNIRVDPEEFYALYGIALEQVYTTRGDNRYKVVEIDALKGEAKLEWLGSYEYFRVVTFDQLSTGRYTLISGRGAKGYKEIDTDEEDEEDAGEEAET